MNYEEGERKSSTFRVQQDSKSKAIVPMTVSMVLEHSRTEHKVVDEQPFENAVVVGRLIEHSVSASKHFFTINDDTGVLRAQLIVQVGRKPAYLDSLQVEPLNKYVKCVLTPKLTGASHDEPLFLCNRIEEVEDKNYLSLFLSEVILRHLQRKSGFPHR